MASNVPEGRVFFVQEQLRKISGRRSRMTQPKYNPFRPNSIITPGMFVGRKEEIDSIAQALFQTKHGNPQHFLIEGERGIGKSSLLLLIESFASGNAPIHGFPSANFLVVSQELKTSDTYNEIIKKIGSNLKRAVNERERLKKVAKSAWDFLTGWEILGVKYNKRTLEEAEPYELLNELVEAMEKLIKSSEGELDGILILIDEADKPDETANLGEMLKLLTERLTKRQCDRVVIGLSGLPTLIPRLRASHESSPRVFNTLSLKPLEQGERQLVITSALKEAKEKNGFETRITEDSSRTITQLSEGYPHFIQQFGYYAFEEDTDNEIDQQDVVKGAFKENGALEQLGHKYFNDLYFSQIGSDDYRKVLNAMAEYLDNWVDRDKIKEKLDIKDHTLNNAINALKKKNIIIPNPRQKGEFKLPTRSFAVWIRAYSSLAAKSASASVSKASGGREK